MTREYYAALDELVVSAVGHIFDGLPNGCPQVVIGPIVWEPSGSDRRWYFVVASGGGGFHAEQLVAETKPLAEVLRSALWAALVQRRPIVVHDMDDELEMARLCAAVWPCERTTDIATAIARERAEEAIAMRGNG